MKKTILSLVAFIFSIITFAQSSSEILVLSAVVKDKVIPNAEVIFQKNGATSVSRYTNSSGKVTIPQQFRNDASVVVIIKKEGYSALVTKCLCDGLTYAISPTMYELDGMRIVLNWGYNPQDIDSHLSYEGGYVCYHDKDASQANLDVDDTDSYGPETITITRKEQGKKYVYAVHNFTDRESINNSNLSNISNAKVFIYIGDTLIKTYTMPRGKKGTVWIPFLIDENGNIVNVGDFKNATTWQGVRTLLRNYRHAGDNSIVSSSDKSESIKVNRKGEQEYHAGNLENAVALYQNAIELNHRNGQAYSNLGLAFQKLNKEAEALWANRKAIDLAYGSKAHIVRASSYYNIARIYEKKGQWADALQNFKNAKRNREHRAYNEGISRMSAKLR
ncbi:tetratricopeptide repeat protein [Tenacibaculum sp. M341]|uniref:tetratricopeptide repeat protein n=1 Tax=Tenacibaculum sp. M341 TaxID=2530339 RepID=UPI00104E2BEB|nr:tetratricopeptide repeat protein [Tenacibaculum sp. M341]TCI94902.1 tetratricopeptide repeat protein [Tenacibaculum sp. M341]